MYPTTHGALRRLALAAGLGGLTALLLSATAEAAAPTRIDAEYWGVDCVTAIGDGQTLFLFGSGTTDGAEGGVGAFVEDESGSVVAEGWTGQFGFGDAFTVSLDLAGHPFAIDAGVSRSASHTEPVEERDGNGWTKGTMTVTELGVTPVSASYDGAAIELAPGACTGEITAFDVRTTNPAASIHRDSEFDSAICDVQGLPDAQVRVTGVLPDAYVELVLDHGGEDVEEAQGEIRLRGGRGSLTTDVVDLYAGEVRTTAEVGLALTRDASRVHEVSSDDGVVERRTITPYRETVTVALADGRAGTAQCAGVAVTTQVRMTPNG